MQNTGQAQSVLDRGAVTLSGLCLVHCLMVSAALMLAPLLGISAWGHDHVHEVLLLIAGPVSATALYLGYRRHRNIGFAVLAFTGLALMAWGVAQPELLTETALTVTGVCCVGAAHMLNWRQNKAESGCHQESGPRL